MAKLSCSKNEQKEDATMSFKVNMILTFNCFPVNFHEEYCYGGISLIDSSRSHLRISLAEGTQISGIYQ